MGWYAQPQTAVQGQQSPQDLAIISWFEICHDAGMLPEQYGPCYRAAQARKRELLLQGKELTIVTPHDLCAELDKVRRMNAEIDRTRLLPENAASLCLRCFGKKPAVDTCDHQPLTDEEQRELARKRVEEVRRLRADLASKPAVKSMPAEEFKMDLSVTYTCTVCARKVKSDFGWNYHDRCNARLPGPTRDGETYGCDGVMEVL